MKWNTDISTNQVLCKHCHKLHPVRNSICDRCDASLHQRKPNSLLLSWSFLIASFIFIIPANLLPIMIVTSLGTDEPGTIMQGVIYFFHSGAYGIGLVIFIASVAVPFFKLAVLLFLLLSVQFKKSSDSRISAKYYRIIHFIGKWSMLDIFVVALMVAMVQFKNLATIHTGPAALAFALAVVMTIIATDSFDTRLLWDKKDNTHE